MDYTFPVITHIDQVLEAIEGSTEFIVADRGDHTIIDYAVVLADTFPPIKSAGGSAKQRAEREERNKIRRECRGIIFDTAGNLIRRPYHKFFNLSERPETSQMAVDISKPHKIYEKLDGSMVAPYVINGRLIWGTKMGDTDIAAMVAEFVSEKHIEFALALIGAGFTPIFEFCSQKNRVVIDHPEDRLVLTAIRDMKTGNYINQGLYDVIQEIDTVKELIDFEMNISAIAHAVANFADEEGVVLRFEDGHMVKIKSDWYLRLHKIKDRMPFERNVVDMILHKEVDDIIGALDEGSRHRLEAFQRSLYEEINHVAFDVFEMMADIWAKKLSKKEAALGYLTKTAKPLHSLVFKMMDNPDEEISYRNCEDRVIALFHHNTTSNVKWDDFKFDLGLDLVY